ncbi:MAG: maleylpyruvate isomerase family mycothiol-dependent enzyme [Thermomicrobiales bacterium]
MSSVRERRESISRDLDAFVSRLHDLKAIRWSLPTSNDGWDIRHLAAHVANTTASLNHQLRIIVQPGIAAAFKSGEPVTFESDPDAIIGSLTINRNALISTLAEFTNEHLTMETGDPSLPIVMSGEIALNFLTCEMGLHLYDLNAALGQGSAGLSGVTIEATANVFEITMIPLANANEIKPDAPLSFHFTGSLVDTWVTWTGKTWVTKNIEGIPSTRVQSDDTALVLFICGRIPANGNQLGVTGNRAALAQFKTWIPGP